MERQDNAGACICRGRNPMIFCNPSRPESTVDSERGLLMLRKTHTSINDRSLKGCGTEYDPPIRQWALRFEDYVKSKAPNARQALDRLLRAGCKQVVLIELLHGECVMAPKVREGFRRERGKWKQRFQPLSRDIRCVANGLRSDQENLAVIEALWKFTVPSSKDRHVPESQRASFAEKLQELLTLYAEFLEVATHSHQFVQDAAERSIELPILAAYVRGCTAKKQYPELSLLLNAAYDFQRRSLEETSPDAVRKGVKRFKKDYPSFSNRIDKLAAQYFAREKTCTDFLDWMYKNLSDIPFQ